MKVCVFAGPTLPPQNAARDIDVIWLPPARQGDVYRAVVLLQPAAVGIVDGYFQSVPSVWHKEILWALTQGVHVFGAGSMGALRAAELAPFGMHGVGKIYNAYRSEQPIDGTDDVLEDDDEVAVLHGPADSGYLAASEAMVNIRCTLECSERAKVISATTRRHLLKLAKAQFFADRTYPSLLKEARACGLPEDEIAALECWLPAGRVNQKRADALAMLDAIKRFLAGRPEPVRPNFVFEHTSLWEDARLQALRTNLHDPEEQRVLDELRLHDSQWRKVRSSALISLIEPHGVNANRAAEAIVERLKDANSDAVESILDDAARAALAQRITAELPLAVVERHMLSELRKSGQYEGLRARAADKQEKLGARRDLPEIEAFPDLKLLELSDWYFSGVLDGDIPDDIERWVAQRGYGDLRDFHRTIFGEYVYRKMTEQHARNESTPA